MKQEIRQEEAKNMPLSTAALAHVDDRNSMEEHAEERGQDGLHEHMQARTQDRLSRPDPLAAIRESNGGLKEPEPPPMDGRPALVQSAVPRTGEAPRDQNRIGAASRPAGSAASTSDEEQVSPLFSDPESKNLYARWDALQVGFIDEPRRAVEQADHLVAAAMKRTAEIFADERARLEGQWDRGDDVSTEDLRVAMRRYRSFFRRLLAV
jgi:hypothetical protein